ncbi:MAG: hypothetical protein NUV46_01600 [Nanoarchaeota archaeon]|nr:hypothetical protein [Nanoarchaeota archaeon]
MNKKILIVLIKWGGGVGRVINSIKPLLEEKGYEVEVISREDDLKCYSLKSSLFKLRNEVKKRRYDILYTQDWSCTLALIDFKNHYCCFHGQGVKFEKAVQSIVGDLMGKRLFVVGDKLKKEFPKSKLIYNGVNKKVFYNLKKERKYLGWIKRDYEEINQKGIKEMAKKYKLPVSIAEKIPPEKMNEWYNSLKVFVSYPKSFTGFNICWLEAKASGVPEILGNENGVGISKIKENGLDFFSWENHVNKLVEVFE